MNVKVIAEPLQTSSGNNDNQDKDGDLDLCIEEEAALRLRNPSFHEPLVLLAKERKKNSLTEDRK